MTAFLFDNPAFPIVTNERDIVPALRDPFCRAVTLRDPALVFDGSSISALYDEEVAKVFGRNEDGRVIKKPGDDIISSYMDDDFVRCRAQEAGIVMDESAVQGYRRISNAYRDIFTRVVNEYSGTENAVRSFPLFAPIGGTGRAPFLHIDMNILNFHWSVALSPLSIANGNPSEETWTALDFGHSGISMRERLNYLEENCRNPENDMRDNKIGDAIFFKGQRNVDLSDVTARQSVCAHASSDGIAANGQVAFSMAPPIF